MKKTLLILLTLFYIIACTYQNSSENSEGADKPSINQVYKEEYFHRPDTISKRIYDKHGNMFYLAINGYKNKLFPVQNIPDVKQAKIMYMSYIHTESNLEDFLNPNLELFHIVHTTSLQDSTIDLSNCKKITELYFARNKNFNIVIRDTLPKLRTLGVVESKNGYSYRVDIDTRLFPKLETLHVYCRACEVILPKKKIKNLRVTTDKMDTSYINLPPDYTPPKLYDVYGKEIK